MKFKGVLYSSASVGMAARYFAQFTTKLKIFQLLSLSRRHLLYLGVPCLPTQRFVSAQDGGRRRCIKTKVTAPPIVPTKQASRRVGDWGRGYQERWQLLAKFAPYSTARPQVYQCACSQFGTNAQFFRSSPCTLAKIWPCPHLPSATPLIHPLQGRIQKFLKEGAQKL